MAEESQQGGELEKVVAYMRAHWPSKVKREWQVGVDEYPKLVERAVADLTVRASVGRRLIRVAGISGSGKTTQVLPAAEAYCKKRRIRPVLVAARRFVEYHPHYEEILKCYGEKNVRKMTDEFSTIMMFLVLSKLIRDGYDVILDVTLLDPEMEKILVKMLIDSKYEMILMIVAVSPVVTEKFLEGRAWRHTQETEMEFVRATDEALEYYAAVMPRERIVMWSVYDLWPIYDGLLAGCVDVFREYTRRNKMPAEDDEERKEAKVKYFTADSN